MCCDYVSIAELAKPARQLCQHLEPSGYGCTIHNDPQRPAVCRNFMCSWMRGFGSDEDRPDKVGAMVSVNAIENGFFGQVLEIRPGAVAGSAASIIADVAEQTRLPVVISDYESLPPNDRGDRVAVHTSILYRSRRMVGRSLGWLAPEVGLYELVKGG